MFGVYLLRGGLCFLQYNPFGDLSSHDAAEDRVQTDSNGSLIAVSYEARAFGVKRYAQCPVS